MNDLAEVVDAELVEAPQASSTRTWKVWLVRLAVAISAALLPSLMIRSFDLLFVGSAISGGILLFTTLLLLRTEYLPALNVALTPVFVFPFFFPDFVDVIASIYLAVVIIVLSQLVWMTLVWMISRHLIENFGWKVPTVAVLYSAILPYALFNVTALSLLPEIFAWGRGNEVRLGNFMLTAVGLMLVANLYWAGSSRGEKLDQHPLLGFLFEGTILVIPYAALLTFLLLI